MNANCTPAIMLAIVDCAAIPTITEMTPADANSDAIGARAPGNVSSTRMMVSATSTT